MVKICGVRRLDEALAAAQSGADFVGLVFVPGRSRFVETNTARVIADRLSRSEPTAPRTVGLFGDQPLEQVRNIIESTGVDVAQLCGEESVEYCRSVQELASVIKVLHVPNKTDDDTVAELGRQIEEYHSAGCFVTLDSHVVGWHGGTGQSFDWTIAARLAEQEHQFMIAGGLTPTNVVQAISEIGPWGVDVSSGVETDGEKDADKIRQFVLTAKNTGQTDED